MLLPWATLLVSILTIVLCMLPSWLNIYQRVVSLILGGSVLLWIQGNIILWNYGLFDGQVIKWSRYSNRGIIDGIIWIVVIVLFSTKFRFFNKVAKNSLFFLLFYRYYQYQFYLYKNQIHLPIKILLLTSLKNTHFQLKKM